jgi:2',3'-cyclic-nucleotide 2'-phosphodiesterase (5'-nucleotidase family)
VRPCLLPGRQALRLHETDRRPLTPPFPNLKDETYQAKVDKWRKPFDKYARKVIGRTEYDLDQSRCKDGECACRNLGSHPQDASPADLLR